MGRIDGCVDQADRVGRAAVEGSTPIDEELAEIREVDVVLVALVAVEHQVIAAGGLQLRDDQVHLRPREGQLHVAEAGTHWWLHKKTRKDERERH